MLTSYRRTYSILAVLSLALFLTACGGSEERQVKYLERAQEHFDNDNMDKALIDVKNVLQINPNNVDAHFLMAEIAEQEQDWRKAFGELNYVVEQQPDHVEAVIKLAQLTLAANDPEGARTRAQAAYDLAPDNADALALMAAVRFKDGDQEEALGYAERALAADAGNVTAVSLMAALAAQEDPVKGLEYVDAGIAANPEAERLRLIRLQLLASLNRPDDVVEEYKALIGLAPENYAYVGQLAEYLVNQFRQDEALALLRESVASKPESNELKIFLVRYLGIHEGEDVGIAELKVMVDADPENYELAQLLAQYYARTGEVEAAREIYRKAIEQDELSANAQSARHALSSLAIADGDFDAANELVEEMLSIESSNPDALLNRAGIKQMQGDFQAAIPDLRLVLRSQPDSINALLMLAQSQQKTGAGDLALDNYRTVLASQPDNAIALYQSSLMLSAGGEYDEAIANLEKLLTSNPQNIQAINALTGLYSQQGRWDEAGDLLDNLSDNEGSRAVSDLLRAGLELRRGDNQKSLELAKSALKENPLLVGAVPIAARAYARMGDVEGAINYVAPYLEKYPDNVNLSDIQAQLFLANEQPMKAEDVLLSSIEAVPARTATYLSLARLYYSQGKTDDIVALYRKGIESNPANPILRAELALRYQLAGDYDGALAELEKAYEADPKSQLVQNNLAAIILDHFVTEENLRRVQQMTFGFEDSGKPAQLDTLGWLQYRLGNIPQAISLLEAAQAAGGQGIDYWYHLGMAYAKAGQTTKAREQLEKALAEEYAEYHARAEISATYDAL